MPHVDPSAQLVYDYAAFAASRCEEDIRDIERKGVTLLSLVSFVTTGLVLSDALIGDIATGRAVFFTVDLWLLGSLATCYQAAFQVLAASVVSRLNLSSLLEAARNKPLLSTQRTLAEWYKREYEVTMKTALKKSNGLKLLQGRVKLTLYYALVSIVIRSFAVAVQ